MDGWIDEWMDKWVNVLMKGKIDGTLDGSIDVKMDGNVLPSKMENHICGKIFMKIHSPRSWDWLVAE